jgi:glutathione-specific gamma-glutamylcyclotransferase
MLATDASVLSSLKPDEDLWVFGYGSLMWNPGFVFAEQRDATLSGFHRAFCLYSHHYRGTLENPGLVLGLDHGGDCRGSAFRVEAGLIRDVVGYLNERELVSYDYLPRYLDITIAGGGAEDDGERFVKSYTFVADTTSEQYAGALGLEQKAELIMKAQGIAGLNRDYLINTVRHMNDTGYGDPDLQMLLSEVERRTGMIDMGGGI